MIPALEHPWCLAFYRSHKHLKEQELVSAMFLLLGIWLRNSVVAVLKVTSLV